MPPPDDHHPTPWNPLRRILVATDGSPISATAVEMAVELAAEHEAELIVVHVVPLVDVVAPVSIQGTGIALLHEPSAFDRALLDDAAAVAAERGVLAVTELLAGSTTEEILAFGESRDVDLIVVGSRGHGALASALLGSVSLGVLRGSKRPVLIAHCSGLHAATVEVGSSEEVTTRGRRSHAR